MSALLVFSRDPGATNYLLALLELISGPDRENDPAGLVALRGEAAAFIGNTVIAARGPGEQIWRAAGHAPVSWQAQDEAGAAKLITDHAIGLVLTGTSDLDESGDRSLWMSARQQGIKSHAVLDHPANLNRRFSGEDGSLILPDWIYLSDRIFLGHAVAAGVPAERVRIIGDVHHARLARIAAGRSGSEIAALRRAWRAKADDFVLLFVSECGREMRKAGRDYPFDEVEILGRLVREVARGKLPDGNTIDPARARIVIRPHPRDTPGKYDEALPDAKTGHAVVSAEGPADTAILAADLVVGMTSSMLHEARLLNRPVISLTGHLISSEKSATI